MNIEIYQFQFLFIYNYLTLPNGPNDYKKYKSQNKFNLGIIKFVRK